MIISAVTLVADVVLDIFLIYGLAGVPKLGANGSAYSTVAVELIALIWCIAESHRGDSIHPDWQGLRWFSADITKDLLKISAPMLASSLAWGLSISMHSLIMGHMGSDATAAASITSVAQELVTCVCKGVAAGSGIMIGKLLGQDLFDKSKAYGRQFWIISIWVGFIHMLALCAWPHRGRIFHFNGDGEALLNHHADLLRIVCVCLFAEYGLYMWCFPRRWRCQV